MIYRAMLDTNIVSNALRYPNGSAAHAMTLPGQPPVCVSVIVAAELRFGAQKLGSARLVNQIIGVLDTIDVLPLEANVAQRYAEIRVALEALGKPIGPHDLLIAAHALALDLPLVTDNIREFSRVPNLRVENWLD
jgi:tRNA(fMet)-specific endonuclease VapC